jgi:hypothetical protein
MCRPCPYIDTNNPRRHMQFDVNIRFYEYWHEQVKIRKIRWNNKEIKLGHVSIPKRRIFLPLFLFCAYDSSVLKNFKIFTHLLPNFSYKDARGTDHPPFFLNFCLQIYFQ